MSVAAILCVFAGCVGYLLGRRSMREEYAETERALDSLRDTLLEITEETPDDPLPTRRRA